MMPAAFCRPLSPVPQLPFATPRVATRAEAGTDTGKALAGGQVLIDALMASSTFLECRRVFGETTGMSLSLRALEPGRINACVEFSESGPCALAVGEGGSSVSCRRLEAKLLRAALSGPATVACLCGLQQTAVPLRLGQHTLGFLQTGPTLPHKPAESRFNQVLARLNSPHPKHGGEVPKKACSQCPVVPARKMEAHRRLLVLLADYLAMRSNQVALQFNQVESPVIARAKEFIRQNHREKLSLGTVADAVHMNRFYFCKLFKRLAGLTFTSYLSRLRVETAKTLLLNPNRRVSEIAFEVGFESLTHFNLVFKKIAGESPSQYRGRVPVARGTWRNHAAIRIHPTNGRPGPAGFDARHQAANPVVLG